MPLPLAMLVALVSILATPNHAPATAGRWELSAAGGVTGCHLPDGTHRTVSADVRLTGCTIEGERAEPSVDAGKFARRSLFHSPSGARCEVAESLVADGSELRWDVTVRGMSPDPWSAPIELRLGWPASGETRIWAPWGAYRGAREVSPGWCDPLEPLPLVDAELTYGGADYTRPDTISLPLVTLLETKAGFGVTLAESPEDTVLDMGLTTREDGSLTLTHRNHRIAEGVESRFSLHLLLHPLDARAGLRWMVARYPDYFEPPLPSARDIAGCGAYTTYEGPLDAAGLGRMGFRVNWKASFDFPYMGMYLPPVKGDERWQRFGGGTTSAAQLADYSRRMREQGFYVLSYFNVTEFGAGIQYPPPPRPGDGPPWQDANAFLFGVMPGAVLPGADGRPLWTWGNGVATDCGDPAYRAFLLEQARRHVEELPDSSGICIDRMDWLRCYNRSANDGVSWVDGGPARMVLNSWKDLLSELGPTMHGSGKAIFVNPLCRRLDAMREIDGIYDEFGNAGSSLNACSFLALRKPYIAWTPDAGALRPDPDAYFQRHLYMGAFPTAPLPENDHTIRPNRWADRYYFDYGPLLQALTARTWTLGEATVRIERGPARANLFRIPGGWAVPVTFAGDAAETTLRLEGLAGRIRCVSIRPGETGWTEHGMRTADRALRLTVPLTRGCAMVKLLQVWLEPNEEHYLSRGLHASMGTALPGATMRYTLDGSEPTAASRAYRGPLTLRGARTIRCAAFRGPDRVSDILTRSYYAGELPQPVIEPAGGVIEPNSRASLGLPFPIEGAAVRYTLDGSEPTSSSSVYGAPIRLTGDCTLRARLFAPGSRPGRSAVAEYRLVPPEPPLPEVRLSDLVPTRATSGWGGAPRTDRSIQGSPLTIGGTTYDHGVGTHANSDLVYAVGTSWGTFVATVGIDNEMHEHPEASVVFEVWADGALLSASPILRLGQVWRFEQALPLGVRELTLRATDAGDSINCDHADWANAGFLLRR